MSPCLNCEPKVKVAIGDEGLKTLALLNEQKLGIGASLFKLTIHANNKKALEPPLTCNHVTTLWSNMGFSAFLK
jgi:hypothetical protein